MTPGCLPARQEILNLNEKRKEMSHRRGRGVTEKAGFQATGKPRNGIRIPPPGLQKMLPVSHSRPTTSPPHRAVTPASGARTRVRGPRRPACNIQEVPLSTADPASAGP